MPEPVEQLELLLAVAAHGVFLRQVGDELADARAQLVGEVRRRRADQCIDVSPGRLPAHAAKPNCRRRGSRETPSRPASEPAGSSRATIRG